MNLIIIRHGKASHNLGSEKQHTFAGSQIDNDLSKEGIENAHFLASELKDVKIDKIFTSPLIRSKQTTKIIVDDLGKDIPVDEDKNLTEINIGDFAGHTEDEVKNLYPESAKAFYGEEIENWDFPNGENYGQVSERIDRLIGKIKKEVKPNQTILLSGHGMINRVLFYKLVKDRADLWKERSYSHNKIVNIDL